MNCVWLLCKETIRIPREETVVGVTFSDDVAREWASRQSDSYYSYYTRQTRLINPGDKKDAAM